ncbi:NADP-dependent oxidoreductase domain-containing protein [Cladochytrium replicatum]|nr:NADP-dependent oxidoreductase domain-containing protein [Cladochytrium replicatum]
MSTVKLVFGAAGDLWCNADVAQAQEVMNVLELLGIRAMDTARLYGSSEEQVGKYHAGARFAISTKHPGGVIPQGSTSESIREVGKQSFDLLQVDQVDVFYLHTPDPKVPVAETLEAINEMYKEGRFKRFGLSNFTAEQVDEVVRVAKEKGFVFPSVYQGNYSAVWRKQDTLIFPTVRKYGMAFYAYSPMGGGFLSKSRGQILEGAGRFGDGGSQLNDIYRNMYVRPWYLDFADKWNAVSNDSGIPRSELAMRWIVYHSALKGEFGDAVIVGAASTEQLRSTVVGVNRGPLPDEVVKRIADAWESIKDSALSE